MKNFERSTAGPNNSQITASTDILRRPFEINNSQNEHFINHDILRQMSSKTRRNSLSETGQGPLRPTKNESDLPSPPQESNTKHSNDTPHNPTDLLTTYQPERPQNDIEMGLNRSDDTSDHSTDHRWWQRIANATTWLETPTGRDVPAIHQIVPGSGWNDYLKSIEIKARRALMTPPGDVSLSVTIAIVNSIYPSIESRRIIPGAVIGNFLGAYAANKILDYVNPKPYGVLGQAAIGQGINLATTKIVDAIIDTIKKHKKHH